MFAKDFNTLNDIYNQQIFKESVENGVDVLDNPGTPSGPVDRVLTRVTAIKPKKCMKCNSAASSCPGHEDEENMPEEADMVFAKEPPQSGYDDRERSSEYDETNARMAKQELYRIAKMTYMLHDLINDDEELAPWLADKISRAYEGMNSVFAYKDYEQYRGELESGQEIEEGTEGDLFDSINRGSDKIINQIKKVVRYESKGTIEKVLLECVKALEVKK